jgi:hypothetical protein
VRSSARRIALALATLFLGAMALSACTTTAQIEAKQRDECYAIQTEIQAAMNQGNSATGAFPDIGNLVTRLNVKCPADGTYTFDPMAETVSCTEHGSKAQPLP